MRVWVLETDQLTNGGFGPFNLKNGNLYETKRSEN